MKYNKCERCNKKLLSMQGISTEMEGEQVTLCASCWNKDIAEGMGLDFETIELKPMRIKDCAGKTHEFHFLTHMVPSGLSIKAREIIDDERTGYRFSVLGPFGCDQSELILKVYEKIKKGLAVKYLENERYGKSIKDMSVVARIEWDDNYDGNTPELSIDGERVSWFDFGRMLMTFEGWDFRLNIFDPSEESIDSGVNNKVEKFTPEAKKIWDSIPFDAREKILSTVWCSQCPGAVKIRDYSGSVKKGLLVLKGFCASCGKKVARAVE